MAAPRKRITVPAILPVGPEGMDLIEDKFAEIIARLKDNHIHSEIMSDSNRHFHLGNIETLFKAVSKAYREVCKIDIEPDDREG